jgi:hypothetical protein
MRRSLVTVVGVLFIAVASALPLSAAIKGDYVEVRSADVYTGPCFANAEENLEGKQAILAWKIREGSWQGVSLDGLSVVAVVKANATLGDTYHNPYPTKSVLILDERANSQQRNALVEFVKSAAGPLVKEVVRLDTAPIALEMSGVHGSVKLVAGNLARVRTRSLCQGDHLCGNEEVYYPPLTKVAHAMPAYTLNAAFTGAGLGEVWDRSEARSAFIGSFNL